MANSRPSTGGLPIVLAIIAIVLAAIAIYQTSRTTVSGSGTEVYDRVVKAGTLRVGYVAYPPASIVDPRTGAVSGVFPDILREIGRVTSLKVEFVQETTYADMIEGLNSDKFDVVGGVWANPNRGKVTTMSVPIYYTGVGIWVRPNENRFGAGSGWQSLNDPSVRIAAIDGSTPLNVIKEQFPKATLKTYPNTTSESQLFLDVVQNKADVFFAEPAQGFRFLASNPRMVKDISGASPLRVFASVYLLPKSQPQLKTLLDTAIQELQSSGRVEEIISRYEPQPGVFMRPAKPYQLPGNATPISK